MADASTSSASPADYRTGVRATRALADGADAFFATIAAIERDDGYDPARFARFLRDQHVRQWFTVLVDDSRAPAVLGAETVHDLARIRQLQGKWLAILLEVMKGVDRVYTESGIDHLYLKGLFLAERLYDDPRRRKQSDVDVLVAPEAFLRAIPPLGKVGFDMQRGADARPLERRLAKFRSRHGSRAPQTLTLVREDGVELDLHCRLKSRTFPGIDEREMWPVRQRFVASGDVFETLSDEHTLVHLIVSLCADLRRGAGRAKQFLDLYLMLRQLHAETDWEAFFERRAAQRVEKACVNLLWLLFALWKCADEFPALWDALTRRRALDELRDTQEALAIVTRPRHSKENHDWFRRLAPGSTLSYWAWRLTADLPRTLARRRGSRRRDAALHRDPS